MTAKLVIFDCDGVLVDSEPLAARILAEALGQLDWHPLPEETDRLFRGRSLDDIVALVEQRLGRRIPPDFIPELTAATREAFDSNLEPVVGVRDALEAIAHVGLDTCVASSGSPEKIRHSLALTHLTEFFEDRVFSAVQVERGKPAPDLFCFAASQMGHPIEDCVVIEDSLPGVTGAVAAGATALGFVSPSLKDAGEHASALAKAGARVFHRMDDLPRLLSLPGAA